MIIEENQVIRKVDLVLPRNPDLVLDLEPKRAADLVLDRDRDAEDIPDRRPKQKEDIKGQGLDLDQDLHLEVINEEGLPILIRNLLLLRKITEERGLGPKVKLR